ncbi:MAG: hypothetical protein DWQ05_19725 [Calditrichaeota bacterium]|nr:MAG: hypothetical protein DWQ05_19725 [Calditrichota bacterium]
MRLIRKIICENISFYTTGSIKFNLQLLGRKIERNVKLNTLNNIQLYGGKQVKVAELQKKSRNSAGCYGYYLMTNQILFE